MRLRVVVAGQRSFGAAALQTVLDAGHDVVRVVSPIGDPLYDASRSAGVQWSEELTQWNWPHTSCDVIVAAHSHQFIGRRMRMATMLGAVGYHPSLLPIHRGRDAVRWTVRNRDPVAGGSMYWLSDNVDAGPIAAQDWCHVRPDDTPSSLWRRELFPMGLRLIRQTLDDLAAGDVIAVPQDESVATWEPSWERPPLHRPELPELGPMPGGFTLRTERRVVL